MAQAQYLTGPQLVGIAQKAGFSGDSARTYAAIELAESNGAYGNMADVVAALNGQLQPGNYPGLNYHPQGTYVGGVRKGGPEISIGPGQINIVGLNYRDPQAPGYVDPIKLMVDPVYNAKIAFERKSGGGKNFRAWSTFTNGAYRSKLPLVGGQPITPTNTYSTPDSTSVSDQEIAGSGEGCGPQGCLVKFPGVAGVGETCLLSHCQARAIVGGMAMAAGGLLMVGGVALLAVYGFQSNAARTVLKGVGAPGQLVQQRQQTKAAGVERQESADVRAAQRSASLASARNRQESAESKIARRNQTSRPGPRAVGEEPF